MNRLRGRVVAGALVLALVGVACGGGDDDEDEVRTAPSSSTSSVVEGTTTVPPAGETTTTVEAGPETTDAPTVTAAPGPAPTAPPATPAPGPVPLSPAAPGLYRYTTSGTSTINGSPTAFPAVTTNFVDPPVGNRQHASRDLREGNSGNGPLTEYTFEYRPDGVYLVTLRLTTTLSPYPPYPVDLTPPAPLLFLATGAGPGASQVLDIPVPSGGSARVQVDVLGTEVVTIAGQPLDTLVVRSVATMPSGPITGTQTLTVNVHPPSRLWVKERGEANAAIPGILAVHNVYTATIQSLTPS